MKKTFIIEETGEVITTEVESSTPVSLEQVRLVEREFRRNKTKLFSNSEKKKYLIKRKTRT